MVGGQGVVVEAIDCAFSVALSVVGGVPNVAVDTVITLGGGGRDMISAIIGKSTSRGAEWRKFQFRSSFQ